MTPPMQPPEETFCLTCGPDAALERHDGAVLHCPRCGTREPVPDFPLFVVTGASGTGKTTITEPLRRTLPGCDVFDTDIILQVAELGWDTWRNTWLRLAHAIALNGRVTVRWWTCRLNGGTGMISVQACSNASVVARA